MDDYPARRVELSIRIDRAVSQLRLEVDEEQGEDFDLAGPEELVAHRVGLRAKLEHIRSRLTFESLGEALNHRSQLQQAMNDLRAVGTSLGNALFGGADQMDAARTFINDVIPDWRSQDGTAVLLTVHAPRPAMIPFEIVPLFDYSEYWEVSNATSLFEAARRMLGFGTTIQRVIVTRRVPDSRAQPGRRVFCRVVRDDSLSSAEAEIAYLIAHSAADVEGPWPSRGITEDEATSILGTSLIDPSIDFDGNVADPAAIVQFSCHCDTTSRSPVDYRIGMGPRGERVWVSFGGLEARFTEVVPTIPAARRAVPRPLVFLNACGGGSVDPITASSFPDFFVRERFAGFVGPLVDVPDRLASQLGVLFYRSLFRGASVGESLRDARWALLARYGSCLGAFWAAYCRPDQILISRDSARKDEGDV